MAKQFNDIVKLVRGAISVPALVAQSVVRNGEESLTVVYLDPSKASPILSGQSVDNAIKRDFVVPLSEGKTFGWTELGVPAAPADAPPAPDVNENPAGTDFESALKKAGGIITEQADKITSLTFENGALKQERDDLHAKLKELEGVEAQLAETTEGIYKQLQAIADENAVKPKGKVIVDGDVFKPADPTSFADVQAAQQAAKEAAPEATADPTSSDSTSSTSLSSETVESPRPSETPAQESTPQSPDSGIEPQP